ncbi:hypothetical protein ABIE56_000426 [Luteibacter sp. 621]|uniref:hypothetical protein n=1 Tax=Luteibacter sp. 621 TaxID=3373916 RepID=UPI003D1D4BA8
MTINTSNVTPGSSLAISVSGTAYLQRSIKAGVMPGVLPQTDDEKAGSSGKESASEALAKVDAPTREAIEEALKKFDPNASLDTYADGKSYSNSSGLMLHLIA